MQVPTIAQYKRALLAIREKITPRQLSMLKAHYAPAGHAATMTELALAAGYDSFVVANLQYGKLGHLLSDAMGGFISEREDGVPNWTFALAEFTPASGDAEGRWVMRTQVASALEQLGWVDRAEKGPDQQRPPEGRDLAGLGSFEVGRVYDRRRDIHGPYGGQRQGGISTPAGVPAVFLFTGESGEQYGYRDGWNRDGVYLYTGEGQIGGMQFVRGNRAIRDHLANGKDLLLFESLGKGKGNRFLGTFACAGWETRQGSDLKGAQREVIVFHLLRQGEGDAAPSEPVQQRPSLPLEELRRRAYEASSTPAEKDTKHTRRRYYERSEDVRAYVLARAAGICEACRKPAPFKRPDGSPYLEPHHTRRVSDGGPDDPRWVGGICPNCHREIHYGADGKELNLRLQEYISGMEIGD